MPMNLVTDEHTAFEWDVGGLPIRAEGSNATVRAHGLSSTELPRGALNPPCFVIKHGPVGGRDRKVDVASLAVR